LEKIFPLVFGKWKIIQFFYLVLASSDKRPVPKNFVFGYRKLLKQILKNGTGKENF
jgi:hypothetical protein